MILLEKGKAPAVKPSPLTISTLSGWDRTSIILPLQERTPAMEGLMKYYIYFGFFLNNFGVGGWGQRMADGRMFI